MTAPSSGPSTRRSPRRRYAASVAHSANLLRALARDVESRGEELGRTHLAAPLDHPSARDAITLLGWQGPTPTPVVEWALGLSQSACVRVLDRLQEAGLVERSRSVGDRRVWVRLTDDGERAVEDIHAVTTDLVQDLLTRAFPDPEALAAATGALERLVAVAVGEDVNSARFCSRCDVRACLAEGLECPSDQTCEANASRS